MYLGVSPDYNISWKNNIDYIVLNFRKSVGTIANLGNFVPPRIYSFLSTFAKDSLFALRLMILS